MAELTPLTAVVLAGGPPDAVSQLQAGAPNKAFVEIAGIALLGRVLEALRASAHVGNIVAVAPPGMRHHSALRHAAELRPDGARITDSLRYGLAGLDPDATVLLAASDLPILTPVAVDHFVCEVRRLDADVTYGCVERAVHAAKFPEVPHTWAKLRDGTYCGGGLAAIKPRALPLLERFLERLGAARKQPLRLASLFGARVLARYALGRLGVADAERRASELLGAPVRALVSPFAETAVNVDRAGDVPLAETLARQSGERQRLNSSLGMPN